MQATTAKVTVATFDPTVISKSTKELGAMLKRPVEFILTNLIFMAKIIL